MAAGSGLSHKILSDMSELSDLIDKHQADLPHFRHIGAIQSKVTDLHRTVSFFMTTQNRQEYNQALELIQRANTVIEEVNQVIIDKIGELFPEEQGFDAEGREVLYCTLFLERRLGRRTFDNLIRGLWLNRRVFPDEDTLNMRLA